MPRRGERAGTIERRMGFSQYPDAGFRRVQKSRSGSNIDEIIEQFDARSLPGHTVTRAQDRGWDTVSNGDLLAAGEEADFDVLVTADKNMRYQQNLEGRSIALVVLSTPQWRVVSCIWKNSRRCEHRDEGQLHRVNLSG